MVPLISAIVPIYNGEAYIAKIMNCFKAQTFQNFEVIFVNDGSTDETMSKLIENINHSSEKYKVFSQENRGVSAARNLGIDYASGQYICFIDVDDEIHELFFEILYNTVAQSKEEIAFCMASHNHCKINKSIIKTVSYSSDIVLEKLLFSKISTGIWGMIIPTKLLKDNNLKFKEGFNYSEDLHMVWRVVSFSKVINQIKCSLYIYNENEGSAMTVINNNRFDSMLLMEDLELFFEKNNSTFFPLFKKYGKSRMSWSLLWQAAHYLNFNEFKEFTKKYEFKKDLVKLKDYPSLKVNLSSKIFLFSSLLYFLSVKVLMRNYRK